MSVILETTSTIVASTTPTTSMHISGGMDMSDGGGAATACKIAMTWNWYTVGACFVSKSWQITSSSMFAGSCIGVMLLAMSLELLRRMQREFDIYVARKLEQNGSSLSKPSSYNARRARNGTSGSGYQNNLDTSNKISPITVTSPMLPSSAYRATNMTVKRTDLLLIQFFRALLHMLQFAMAYFVMLLAMYYNGYFIICILLGAFLGAFVLTWDQTLNSLRRQQDLPESTGCCG